MTPTQLSSRFSLKSLFAFVTLCAIACCLIVRLGLLGVFYSLFIPVGVVSIRAKKVLPFLQCLGSIIILEYLYWLPAHPLEPKRTVVLAVCCGVGTMLAFAAMRRGHWATKAPALLTFAVYVWLLMLVLGTSNLNWENVMRYWWP